MSKWPDIEKRIKKRLNKKRFEHSMNVALCASGLAARYGYDPGKAELAGLLHDYARDMSDGELLDIAGKNHLKIHPVEYQVPVLLHGPVGALLVRRDLGIEDGEILEAISCHTTGSPGMSVLAEIIYLADIIEPSRDFGGVDALRDFAQQNLHTAVLAAIECSIEFCLEKGLLIHPVSIEARNEMLGKIKKVQSKEGCF